MSLETLFQNARTYLDILRKCSLPEVGRWKEEDLKRAIHWATYFKKVHGRISHRQSIVARLDGKLQEISREMGLNFGPDKLSLDFVANSLEYVTKILLENPTLPSLLREKILSHIDESEDQALISVVKTHLEDVTISTVMLDTLQIMYGKLVKYFPDEAMCHYPGLVAVDAQCLQEWLLEEDTISNTPLVHQKLQEFAKLENGLDTILHMLLLQQTGSPRVQCTVAVLEWIFVKLGGALSGSPSDLTFVHKLWLQTSPKLLAKVSSIHFKFFKEHIKFLVSEVEKLRVDPQTLIEKIQATTAEMNVSESEDVMIVDDKEAKSSKHVSRSSETTVEMLTKHFIELAKSGEHVKDVCLSLLKSRVLLHKTEGVPLMSAVFDSYPAVNNPWFTILTRVIETLQTSCIAIK